MASMTLKQIPVPLLRRLRAQAKRERRSVNQHAIHLLETAVRGAERRPSFGEAIARVGWRPEGLDGTEFDNLRDRASGRDFKR